MEKPLSELVPLIETIIGRSKEVSFAASTTPSAIKSALPDNFGKYNIP